MTNEKMQELKEIRKMIVAGNTDEEILAKFPNAKNLARFREGIKMNEQGTLIKHSGPRSNAQGKMNL